MAHVYSLKKSRNILHWCYSRFQKKKHILPQEQQVSMEADLKELENAIYSQDRTKADQLARELEKFTQTQFRKSSFEYIVEFGVAILLALFIAIIVRQVWFEPFQIPTGSMRPSFREQDYLTVTKTTFGINVPLQAKHLYFDPDLVRRGRVVIFSGHNIPLPDEGTTYFGFIPDKKRYIKRLIGKPGDTLYFYGGKIYGIDKDGKPINELLNDPWMQKLEHIPVLTFEGDISIPAQNQIIFKQMNQPIGKLLFNRIGTHRGEIFSEGQWVEDKPFEKNPQQDKIQTLGDFWGTNNFGMVRLLTKKELETYTNHDVKGLEEAELYLQIRHTPNLTYPLPRLYKNGRLFGVQVSSFETVIPLQRKHLDAIMDNMYTSRFVVKDGRSRRYNFENDNFQAGTPHFSNVSDGTYEFFHGKAEKVGWKGKTSPLLQDDPLYNRDTLRVHELFNMGIEMLTSYDPNTPFQVNYPHRYAYFRNGDLYLMGAPILKKDDPILAQFLEAEEKKESRSTKNKPYLAFKDRGPPLKNGELDIELIKAFGLKIPEKRYLVMGDNHAMSADSRVFGFVPEDNIQGAPSLIVWPPGERWGWPPQTPYPILTLPRLIVWGVMLTILLVWYAVHRRRFSKRLFPE